MSLIQRLQAPPVAPDSQYCTVGKLLDELSSLSTEPGSEFAALAGALSTPGWSAVELEKALREEGHTVSFRHIREHRRGHRLRGAVCAAHDVGVTRPGRDES